MAIETDTFEIPLQVSDGVTKKVDEIVARLNAAIKKIPKDINLSGVDKELKKISQSMKSVNKDVKKVNDSFIANAQTIETTKENLSIYNQELNDNVRNLRLNQSATSRVNAALVKYSSIVDNVTTLTNAFGIGLRNALNPRTLNRLENLLSIFAALAKMRGLDRLARALLAAQQKVEDLELAVTSLAENGENDFERLAASADAFNGRLGALGFAVHKVSGIVQNVANEFLSGFLKVFNIFNVLNNTIADVSLVVRSLFDSFQSFTDPAFVNNLANIFTIVSAFMRFRGQAELANFFENAADKADVLSLKLQEIREDGGFSLEKTAEKAKLLTTAIKTVEFAVDGAKLAFAGFIGLQIAKRFETVNTAMGKLDNGLKNLFGRTKVLGSFLNSRFNPGLVKLTEIATIISPLIFGLGKALSESEDAAVAFIGKVTLLASIITGAFATAVTIGIKLVSDFAISIGDKLINVMEKFSKISAKSESVVAAFNFTIEGFNKVVGDSVGTLEFWEKQIRDLVAASTFGSNEIRKGISLLVKEGAALGLNAIQNSKLARIAADVAAATGREFADVSQRIVEGLSGQSQGLLALGINVRETHLEHSVFLKQLGKTISELSDAEKQTLRFNEVIQQTKPLMGAATAAIDTVEGATKVYNRTLEEIQIRIGEADEVTKFYLKTLTNLSTMFLSLPDPILEVIGTFVDFSGVTLKVIGTLVKYILTIGFVVTGITLMNTVLGTSITLQSSLGLVLGTVATRMGVQAVAITSLNALFMQMTLIVRGALLKSLALLGGALLGIAGTIAKVTAQLLINPIFIKAVLIAAGIAAIVKAVTELADELDFLSFSMEDAGGLTDLLASALEGLQTIITKLFGAMVDLSKIILGGLVGGVLLLIRAWKSWQFIMADGAAERQKIQKDIDEIDEKIRKVDETIRESQDGLGELWGNSSAKAEEFKKNIELEQLAANNAKNLAKMEDALASVNKEALKISVLGNEFERLDLEVRKSQANFRGLFEKLKSGADLTKDSIEELKDAYKTFVETSFEMEGLRADTFDEMGRNIQDLRIEMLKMSGQEVKAIRATARIRTQDFDKRVEEIRSVFTLTQQEENKIAEMRKLMAARTEAEIAKIKKKAADEAARKAADAAKKEAGFFANIQAENLNLRKQELEANNQFVAAQGIQTMMELQAHDDKIKRFVEEQKILDENFKLSQNQLDIIKQQRDAILAKNAAEVKKAVGKEQKVAQEAAGPEVQLFGQQQVDLIGSAFGEAAGTMADAASAFMAPATTMMAAAQAIVGAVQQLIDFIPNFINSIANVFNSLTDLPNEILKAMLNLENAVGNFIENFIPNLLKALPQIIKSFIKIFIRLFVADFVNLFVIQIIRELPTFVEELVVAIVEGIKEGLMLAANDIANALGFEDIFDIKADEKLKQIGDEIQRASDQLFQVMELEQVGRGLDVADRIRNAIMSSSSRGADIFTKAWQRLKNWFTNKFGPIISDAWKGFVDNVVTAAKGFGRNISDQAKGFGDNVAVAWKGFVDNVQVASEGFGRNISDQAKGFGDNVAIAWKGFVDNVGVAAEGFGRNVSDQAKGFGDNVAVAAKGFGDNISVAWKGFLDNVKVASDSFGKGLSETGKLLVEFFYSLGQTIWDGLKSVIDFPEIPTPAWIEKFASAVNSLTTWSVPFSSGGLVGKVQNRAANGVGKVVNAGKSSGGNISREYKRVVGLAEGGYLGDSIKVPTGVVRDSVLYAQTGSFAPNEGTDTIDAKLTPGEFVVNREATRNNLGLLSFINSTREPISPAQGTNNFSIVINAKTDLSADQIRREVVPELEKHLRRKSQEGRSVINAAGIRT